MNIQEAATNWAKTEAVYSMFFTFFGVMFLMISLGFWFLGKTDIANYKSPAHSSTGTRSPD